MWDIDPARGTQKRLTGMGGVNQVWVLPRGETGGRTSSSSQSSRTDSSPRAFSNDNNILYLSVQADPPFQSRVIAIQRAGGNFNQPYDR